MEQARESIDIAVPLSALLATRNSQHRQLTAAHRVECKSLLNRVVLVVIVQDVLTIVNIHNSRGRTCSNPQRKQIPAAHAFPVAIAFVSAFPAQGSQGSASHCVVLDRDRRAWSISTLLLAVLPPLRRGHNVAPNRNACICTHSSVLPGNVLLIVFGVSLA